MKQTAVEFFAKGLENLQYNPLEKNGYENAKQRLFDQAKAMEKEQIKNSFVECWKANVPDGVECKLDAEQYYNETFKSE